VHRCTRVAHAERIQLSLLAAADPQPGDRLTIAFLVDVVAAVLATRVSPQTTAVRVEQAEDRDAGP
jgi:hypothetical protein